MSGRRTDNMAAQAAKEAEAAARRASEAGRTLAQHAQTARQERPEPPKVEEKQKRLDPPHAKAPKAEPKTEAEPKVEVKGPRKFGDLHNDLTEEIVSRQSKTEGWKEVEFKDGPDGQKRAVVKDAAPAEKPAEEDQAAAEDAVPAAESATETDAGAEPAAAEPAVRTIRVKVDGEEYDAPAEDVEAAGGVKPYQIQAASEKRLRQANETLAEAKRMFAEAQQSRPAAKPAEPEPSDLEFIASKADAIRFGTPQEYAAAMQEVIARGAKQADPQALFSQVMNQIKHDQAVSDFDREFNDLGAKPLALKLVLAMRNERANQLLKEKKPIDWKSLYTTIGHEVRSLLGGPSQPATKAATTQGPTSQKSDKEARKASIVTLPTAAARAAPPAEPKPQTREEVLDEMRKARIL